MTIDSSDVIILVRRLVATGIRVCDIAPIRNAIAQSRQSWFILEGKRAFSSTFAG